MKASKKRRNRSSNLLTIVTLAVVLVIAGGISYETYWHHHAPAAPSGGWSYLGTATDSVTELGGRSSMATYACIDKVASTVWIVKAKAVLSPIPTRVSDYALTMSDWPYRNVADAPAGGSESPTKQVESNAWSKGSTTIQTNIDPSQNNYIEVIATNKGYAGKILPTPVNELPSASQLTNC